MEETILGIMVKKRLNEKPNVLLVMIPVVKLETNSLDEKFHILLTQTIN